ncbi:MAG: hypothetical protein JNL19_11690 [Burkholderiales bacterium]|nr:hypothetical protein [Burkholderiales bacterium]
MSRRTVVAAALATALSAVVSAQSMCTLVCPANITVPSLPGQQVSAALNYTVPVPNGCVATSATQTAGIPTGGQFAVGVTTNVFAAGIPPEASCQFTVTVTATPALPVPPTQVPVGGGALLAGLGLLTALGGAALLRRKPR